MSSNDLWLDADRETGVTLLRLTEELIREAQEYQAMYGRAPAYGVCVGSLLSQRSFAVTSLRYTDRHPDCFASLRVVQGCFTVLEVPLAILEAGDMDAGPPYPYFGRWPTRLLNPPRQNLSFYVGPRGGPLVPVAVEIEWRHLPRRPE